MKNILIYDTTLRDGEQSPGFSMNAQSKLEVALRLDELNVDVIEAGFPAAAPEEVDAVKLISEHLPERTISVLSRAVDSDLEVSIRALEKSKKPRLHLFIPSSDIQIHEQLKKSKSEVIDKSRNSIRKAKKYLDEVQLSFMDASRSDKGFIKSMLLLALEEKVRLVNISDTVGALLPSEMVSMVNFCKKILNKQNGNFLKKKEIGLSVHCHNDLGLAVANSLAAIEAGVDQIECTLNGIGERAGVASLEEIATALELKKGYFMRTSAINLKAIWPASETLQRVTGIRVQPNKAIVGRNAFSHASGIHQDGMIKNEKTYELFPPSLVGRDNSEIILSKHSGRTAIQQKLEDMGIQLDGGKLDIFFLRYKKFAEQRKIVTNLDFTMFAMRYLDNNYGV